MKPASLFIFLFFSQLLVSQTFTEVPPFLPFENVSFSSIAFSDVDGDNDQDILLSGLNRLANPVTKLYTNDGAGNYDEIQNTPFEGLREGAVAFADVDGDGDQDLFLTGKDAVVNLLSKLYINNGSGIFTEAVGTPFEGVGEGAIAFADVDGDGDQDVLLAGLNSPTSSITKLYRNDGAGVFSEVLDTPFDGISQGSITFADIDDDNDQDLFLSGWNGATPIAKLYSNDGSGNFSELASTPFEGIEFSAATFADVDGDNDHDLLLSGGTNSGRITKLYKNNGLGIFSELTGTPFEGLESGSVAFTDVDDDNDLDLFLSGWNGTNQIAKLYANNGSGTFSEVSSVPFEGVDFGSVAFADIDDDNDQDILITGQNNMDVSITKLYTNNGEGKYNLVVAAPLEGVYRSAIAFADVDDDNDQDIILSGLNSSDIAIAKLYTNDGLGTYSEVTNTPFDGLDFGELALADIDGDGDQDVLLVGWDGSGPAAKLYRNNGSGTFTEVVGTPFTGTDSGSVAFADVDNDGDQDVLLTGITNDNIRITELYTNNGSGTFSEVLNTPFDGVNLSSVAFTDIDNDGDQDVLLTGLSSADRIAKLYTNNGAGTFSEVTGAPFDGVILSAIAFADIDGDNDQDVLITGENNMFERVAKLYTNDGEGNFTEVAGSTLQGVNSGAVAFADVDNDNDTDLLITGRKDDFAGLIAKLYINDGLGNFSELSNTPFEGVIASSVAFADVDNDNDQDVLITGLSGALNPISKLYLNQSPVSSTEEVRQQLAYEFELFPNPTKASKVKARYRSPRNGSVNIQVFNLYGSLLFENQISIGTGEHILQLDISSLEKGAYIIQLEDGVNRVIQKLIIQ